jgi:hypothetical protein
VGCIRCVHINILGKTRILGEARQASVYVDTGVLQPGGRFCAGHQGWMMPQMPQILT